MPAFLAKNCKVFINNVDISSMVRSVDIRAHVGEIVTSTLVLYARPTMDDDGSIHYDISVCQASQGPVQTPAGPARAIRIRHGAIDVEEA